MTVKPYRYHVLVCTASGAGNEMYNPPDPCRARFCGDKGGEKVREQFRAELERAGIDYVKVTRLGCMVQHKQGPIVIVYPDGIWYAGVQPADVAEIVDSHLQAGQPVERLVYHKMEQEQE
jgi:(2Fe-2S) ferredoxin